MQTSGLVLLSHLSFHFPRCWVKKSGFYFALIYLLLSGNVRNDRASHRQREWQQLCLLWRKCHLSSTGPNVDALGTRAGCPWFSSLVGRFSPRWTQEPRLSPAGESAAHKSPGAFYLFIKLIQALVGFYVYCWAQMPFSVLSVTF